MTTTMIGEHRLVTRLGVDVVSGELHPVAWLPVDVEYEYPFGSVKHHRAVTDGDGRVVIVDHHADRPVRAVLSVAGETVDLPAPDGYASVVVEL